MANGVQAWKPNEEFRIIIDVRRQIGKLRKL